jgi:hypothetical protein
VRSSQSATSILDLGQAGFNSTPQCALKPQTRIEALDHFKMFMPKKNYVQKQFEYKVLS